MLAKTNWQPLEGQMIQRTHECDGRGEDETPYLGAECYQ